MDKSRDQNNWYIAYTCPRSEKKADKKLKQMGIVSFLPLRQIERQWCDRRKRLEVPLFPSYIFINTRPQQRLNALRIKELVKFVSFEGRPAVIEQEVVDSLKHVLKGDVQVYTDQVYDRGRKVKINQGRFAGAEGIITRMNGKTQLMVEIEALRAQVAVDISLNSNVDAMSV